MKKVMVALDDFCLVQLSIESESEPLGLASAQKSHHQKLISG